MPAGMVRRAAVRVVLSPSAPGAVPFVRATRPREAVVLAVDVEDVEVALLAVATGLARGTTVAILACGCFALAPISSAPVKTPLRPAFVMSPNAGRLRRAAMPVDELGPLSFDEGTTDVALLSSL